VAIRKTLPYILEHEADVDWETVLQVIRSTKGKRMGSNLIRYLRKTKSGRIYVLCGIDKDGNLRVINAKRE